MNRRSPIRQAVPASMRAHHARRAWAPRSGYRWFGCLALPLTVSIKSLVLQHGFLSSTRSMASGIFRIRGVVPGATARAQGASLPLLQPSSIVAPLCLPRYYAIAKVRYSRLHSDSLIERIKIRSQDLYAISSRELESKTYPVIEALLAGCAIFLIFLSAGGIPSLSQTGNYSVDSMRYLRG